MKDSDFMRGAKMAYDDCADLLVHFDNNLPPELHEFKGLFCEIAGSFREKYRLMESASDMDQTKQ